MRPAGGQTHFPDSQETLQTQNWAILCLRYHILECKDALLYFNPRLQAFIHSTNSYPVLSYSNSVGSLLLAYALQNLCVPFTVGTGEEKMYFDGSDLKCVLIK